MPNKDPIENQIQLNSLWSWSQLISTKNIIVFVDDESSCVYIKNIYRNLSCQTFSKKECFHDSYHRPYLSCAFDFVEEHRQTSISIFVNGDIMLDQSVFHSISFIHQRQQQFFIVGCRRDFTISSIHNHSNSQQILNDALNHSQIHSTTGIDLIAYRINSKIRMARFLVGVYRWDNWLLSEILLRTNVNVIDITQSAVIIHQQQPIAQDKQVIHHSQRHGAIYNDQLTKNLSNVDYKLGFIHNANEILVGDCHQKQCQLKENLYRSEIILLKQRADANNYIAILTVTSGYMSMAWNWICWARRINFHNYIFLAEDYESYRILREHNEPVYISNEQSLNSSIKHEAKYGSYEFQITMTYRLEFLMRVLRAGYHFLSADLDTIWLDNPLKYISHNLSITIQGQTHKETKMSGGFIVLHATHHGRKFWQDVITCQHDNLLQLRSKEYIKQKRPPSDFTEQECINNQLKTVRINLLDPYLFPDGRSFFDLHRSQSRGIVPVVIHGNWLVGLENKLNRLKSWNLLAGTTSSCQSIHTGLTFHKTKQIPIRIRILTYNRLQSLQRLLQSLVHANYTGDRIHLDISIDHPSTHASTIQYQQWQQLNNYLHSQSFHWPHGSLTIIQQKKHIGLLGQWTHDTNHNEIQIFFEDDLVVAPSFYLFIKEAIQYYYLNESNYDSRMFGLSLQHQHTVLGQTTGQRLPSIPSRLNQSGSPLFFKYQLLGKFISIFYSLLVLFLKGTWGTVFFPKHWQMFLKWMSSMKLDDVQSGCTPCLMSTEWWMTRYNTGRMWTPWFIRFAFQQGWYSLYTNFNNRQAFAVSYRESGLNFNDTRGPMNPLLQHFQPNIHLQFIRNPPIYDYFFNEIEQPDLLSIRSNLWNHKYFLNQCHKTDKQQTRSKTTTTTIKSSTRSIHQTSIANKNIHYIHANLIQNHHSIPFSSSACFKWFLFFELMFVLPIVIIFIGFFYLFHRKKRFHRRKHYIQ